MQVSAGAVEPAACGIGLEGACLVERVDLSIRTGDRRPVALFVGAGLSMAGGLPVTNELLDGQIWAGSDTRWQHVTEVLYSWRAWRACHGGDVGQFLVAAYHNDVTTAATGALPGATLPWPWVAQCIAARLSAHTGGARGGSSPRYFENIANPSRVGGHLRLLRSLSEAGCALVGVVMSNYDLLAERALRPRAVRHWLCPGFHYAWPSMPTDCSRHRSTVEGARWITPVDY